MSHEYQFSLIFPHIVRLHAEHKGLHDISDDTIQAAGLLLEERAGIIRVGAKPSNDADKATASMLTDEVVRLVGDKLKETRVLTTQARGQTHIPAHVIGRLEVLMGELTTGLSIEG
jgi:hypothetical protein